MRKKGLAVITLIMIIALTGLACSFNDKVPVHAVYENGQMGIVTGSIKKAGQSVFIEDREVLVYPTCSDTVQILFESMDLNNAYDNSLTVNERFSLPLKGSEEVYGVFISNEISILGLNIENGILKLSFRSGTSLSENRNTFSLRNIRIMVAETEIWSDEYSKEEYYNEPINFGDEGINDDLRTGYKPSETLTFTVPSELLDVVGLVLNETYENESISVVCDGKETLIANESIVNVGCNIQNQEVISETKELQITRGEEVVFLSTKMDGMEIPPDLIFTKNAWSSGDHWLAIEAENSHGFKKNLILTFTLESFSIDPSQRIRGDIFQTGVGTGLFEGIGNLGVKIGNESLAEISNVDGTNLITSFDSNPVISFVIAKGTKTSLVWSGKVNQNRTAFMQIFNHDNGKWETVSSELTDDTGAAVLGYDWSQQPRYEKYDKIHVRVSSEQNMLLVTENIPQIFHFTDIQYINQLYSLANPDSPIAKAALNCLQSMVDYIIDSYQNDHLVYLMATGDFVQQQKGVTLSEWENLMTLVINPLLEAGVPLGVSSGNHDVGGTTSYNPTGGDTLDEFLVYDYFSENLGESVFNGYSYYGESFQDNRSHFDQMTINGHKFLFLYLGWGSSAVGIHVSSIDVAWAKTVLAAHPEETVVLATHQYLGGQGTRSATGEYLFQELVSEYANIKFVFCGHANGGSKKIDAIDDDGDGINDRLVLQILTDFQEEEQLYGASFMRTLGLNFENNVILFNQYSPYFGDSDIILTTNAEYSKNAQEFYYAFDLSNCGFGIMTDYFG